VCVCVYIYTHTHTHTHTHEVQHQENETNSIAREPRVGGERQTDSYRTCSDLSQCYRAQLNRFTQYKWMHLQI